ncbi:cation channel sperm-associated auxiliary subunit beta-like [Erythrolamprus reginae]|uniref:cation channel sperm-associated auxiliary subunit beta-like n=1 Tax=Erythrolamprus reginae TaxID=121349 RepID=UPI00396CCA35
MELLWLYILLGAVLKLSSGTTYNRRDVSSSYFACYTVSFSESEIIKGIKLFLPRHKLEITCHLYDINAKDTKENRRKNLLLYASAGLAPSIQIFNRTYSKVFFFNMTLGEDEEVDSWSISIPREKITYNTDIAPIEEWFVKFNMHHGLGMFTTAGTLLDIMREPILQWFYIFGVYADILDTITEIKDVKITKSPCAGDVALIGVIYEKADKGLIIGITYDGFMEGDLLWYNLTNNICVLMDYDCSDLALVDVILMNTRLIMLTTLGLFISEDLRYPGEHKLKFSKPALCGFEMNDYYEAKIWYNRQCLANREYYEEDFISLSFNKDKTLSQESTCFYSTDSFKKWHSCLPHKSQAEKHLSRRVVSFVIDHEQNTGIALLWQNDEHLVSVHKLKNGALSKKTKFPTFKFPGKSFKAVGLYFHEGSHFVYAYGNQIWGSFDGGNSFIPMITLTGETAVKVDSCSYTQGIIFVTDKRNVYFNKAGLIRYTLLATMPPELFSMYFDHLGNLNHIRFNSTTENGLLVSVMDMNKLMQETDLGFEAPLSPHFITEEQMLFFHHGPQGSTPTFSDLHRGKRLDYLPGGSAIINTIFTGMNPEGTVSSILVDVLEPFTVESLADSPCTGNDLLITFITTTTSRLTLIKKGSHVFKKTDIGKTVVYPGAKSYFITRVLDNYTALGTTTLPDTSVDGYDIHSEQWFLYDFGTTNGRKWKIVVDTCRHVVQQFDDLPLNAIKYLDVGEDLSFSFRVTPVNTAFIVFHQYMMTILIGRPSLLDLTTDDYWDDNHSYIFNFIARSRFFQQDRTTVAVVLTYASISCDVTTIILTLKSSCSYLKAAHYVLPYKLSPSAWLSSEDTFGYNNSEISKYLAVLPVNYRPPSEKGIAVPLTDNFYNADPSKPRMRDYFKASKDSGKYKQCANKLNRADCKCADYMKLSFSVAFSDCKEKALRMKFPVQNLPLYFVVEDEGYVVNLSSPYFVTIKEVNNRTNWNISGSRETPSLRKLRTYLEKQIKTKLYNPEGLTISITGSELFHFRVSIIPGVSFCKLFDEFQLYIDDSPLAFPGQYLISTVVAVSIGGILFTTFLLHIYEIQILNFFKKKKISNKVESKTSIVSEVSSESNES